MGLFDRFRKKREEPSQSRSATNGLPQVCYEMAYFMLPEMLFSNPQRVIGYFTEAPVPAGPFLYIMFCKARGLEPSTDILGLFQAHSGEFSEGQNYYVLEYPRPEKEVVDLAETLRLKPGGVLSPFFSAILHTPATGAVAYYILGQRPMGGTTVRTILPEGVNANLGEGPAPTLEGFLDAIRQRQAE